MTTIVQINFPHANDAFGLVKSHLSPGAEWCFRAGGEWNISCMMLGSGKFNKSGRIIK